MDDQLEDLVELDLKLEIKREESGINNGDDNPGTQLLTVQSTKRVTAGSTLYSMYSDTVGHSAKGASGISVMNHSIEPPIKTDLELNSLGKRKRKPNPKYDDHDITTTLEEERPIKKSKYILNVEEKKIKEEHSEMSNRPNPIVNGRSNPVTKPRKKRRSKYDINFDDFSSRILQERQESLVNAVAKRSSVKSKSRTFNESPSKNDGKLFNESETLSKSNVSVKTQQSSANLPVLYVMPSEMQNNTGEHSSSPVKGNPLQSSDPLTVLYALPVKRQESQSPSPGLPSPVKTSPQPSNNLPVVYVLKKQSVDHCDSLKDNQEFEEKSKEESVTVHEIKSQQKCNSNPPTFYVLPNQIQQPEAIERKNSEEKPDANEKVDFQKHSNLPIFLYAVPKQGQQDEGKNASPTKVNQQQDQSQTKNVGKQQTDEEELQTPSWIPSYFNVTKVSRLYILGWVTTEQELKDLLERHERATLCPFVSWSDDSLKKNAANRRVVWRNALIETNCPFTTEHTITLACTFGKKHTRKAVSETESNIPKKRRRVFKESRKVDCPAKLVIKWVTFYDEFKVDIESSKAQKKYVMDQLLYSLRCGRSIETSSVIFLQLPRTPVHENHSLPEQVEGTENSDVVPATEPLETEPVVQVEDRIEEVCDVDFEERLFATMPESTTISCTDIEATKILLRKKIKSLFELSYLCPEVSCLKQAVSSLNVIIGILRKTVPTDRAVLPVYDSGTEIININGKRPKKRKKKLKRQKVITISDSVPPTITGMTTVTSVEDYDEPPMSPGKMETFSDATFHIDSIEGEIIISS